MGAGLRGPLLRVSPAAPSVGTDGQTYVSGTPALTRTVSALHQVPGERSQRLAHGIWMTLPCYSVEWRYALSQSADTQGCLEIFLFFWYCR